MNGEDSLTNQQVIWTICTVLQVGERKPSLFESVIALGGVAGRLIVRAVAGRNNNNNNNIFRERWARRSLGFGAFE